MKMLTATAAAALALAAAGCTAGGHRPISRLDCPDAEDGLKRVSQAADGKSCAYVAEDGAEITLKLIPVSGGLDATLKGLEDEIRRDVAAHAPPVKDVAQAETAPSPKAASAAAAAVAQAEADSAPAARKPLSPEAQAEAEAEAADWAVEDEGGDGRTRVDLPGVHIVADESDDSAQVRIGPLHIDADGEGAEIRMRRDVRLKGEALSREKRGVRATFLLAGDQLPGGGYAGYEAGGPRTGPLAVAIVRGQDSGGDHDHVYDAVKKLVRRNGGV
ncbi:MAG: hypothetical protein ACK4YQ_08900 [Phenylobacterium sp.]|uniref:hypothetical protein n=1 Tax=Phenylobacterium sp. TaxID=1871053 RepID=UPI003919C412